MTSTVSPHLVSPLGAARCFTFIYPSSFFPCLETERRRILGERVAKMSFPVCRTNFRPPVACRCLRYRSSSSNECQDVLQGAIVHELLEFLTVYGPASGGCASPPGIFYSPHGDRAFSARFSGGDSTPSTSGSSSFVKGAFGGGGDRSGKLLLFACRSSFRAWAFRWTPNKRCR